MPQKIYNYLAELASTLDTLTLLPIIDSTNDYLCARRHFKGCHAVFAEQQTAGRGRIGHQWASPPGNLYLSLLWHSTDTLHTLFTLYQRTGAAVLHALQTIESNDVYLKPPNDIFYNNQKLGGILIELFPSNESGYDIVIGVGMNLYPIPTQTAKIITQPWTSLTAIDPQLATQRNKITGVVLKSLLRMVIAKPIL